mgnify:CR=1 FL=1
MKTLVLLGPCRLEAKGKARVLGVEFEKINLPEGSYTVCYDGELIHNCQVMGEGVQCWDEVAESISATKGKVVVLGPVDSGKTYFVKTLVSLKAVDYVVDADVGQNSLFLPGFVAGLDAQSYDVFRFHQNKFTELQFFGSITPSTNYRLHVELISKITRENSVIDMDGWTFGLLAFRHKIEVIELVNPDYIVTTSEKLYRDLSQVGFKPILLKPPETIAKRDRDRRRAFRASAYRAYFKDSKRVSLKGIPVLGVEIAQGLFDAFGETVEVGEECLAEYSTQLRRVYVGLTKRGKVVGAGLLSYENGELIVETPVESFDGIILGSYSLSDFYDEVEFRFRKCRG